MFGVENGVRQGGKRIAPFVAVEHANQAGLARPLTRERDVDPIGPARAREKRGNR
jgi:hypothetical protein